MANSVVKVHDMKSEDPDDSLLLLVGEDGTVIPDQDTVETFLKQRNGPTNIQIMKINRSEKQAIDITVDNVTYMPDIVSEEINKAEPNMDEVARNLHNIKLDHDYTPLTNDISLEEDELAKTLSLLDGPENIVPMTVASEPPPLVMTKKAVKTTPKIKLIQSITLTPPAVKVVNKIIPAISPKDSSAILPKSDTASSNIAVVDNDVNVDIIVKDKGPQDAQSPVKIKIDNEASKQEETSDSSATLPQVPLATNPVKTKAKVIKTGSKPTIRARKSQSPKGKHSVHEAESEEFEDDFPDSEDDENDNDSDFDIEQEIRNKQLPRRISTRTKSETQITPKNKTARTKSRSKTLETNVKVDIKVESKEEHNSEILSEKVVDKQAVIKDSAAEQKSEKKPPPKKKKDIPKQILDDFALFSTPDIIRRVGGKDPPKETHQDNETPIKPAKITDIRRSKSGELLLSPTRSKTSNDNKSDKEKDTKDIKTKERRTSYTEMPKRNSIDERNKTKENKHDKPVETSPVKPSNAMGNVENLQSKDTMNEETTKAFPPVDPIVAMETDLSNANTTTTDAQSLDASSLNLDTTGLDLDPTLLDNLNNDELSEDILYQVAQSLVSNPELQNAIDKGINDGVLDPMGGVHQNQNIIANQNFTEQKPDDVSRKGTQIVRPDGRIVVIPPIERPTTRSRNKRKEEDKPPTKPVHKPLDNEHVSGNELDSDDEEEESEDDPNKLWCICNQPHNNRFMICCDTCEEWYHGKCVNITKAMGQQMEAEGKEWICLYCKDPKLRRPQAAARRVRKASRNSRTSTDSASSASKSSSNSVPCVVCQKPARNNSIYCSEKCILLHAQGIERVVVFERATGKMLTGNKAPSAANLDQWLKQHPGYEVLRSGGKVVTSKPNAGNLTQTKLKLTKNSSGPGVSVMLQNKGRKIGAGLKHSPLHTTSDSSDKPEVTSKASPKISTSNRGHSMIKEPRTKLIQPQPMKQQSTESANTNNNAKQKKSETPKKPELFTPTTALKSSTSSTPNKSKETPIKQQQQPVVKDKTPKTPKNKQPPKDESPVVTPSPKQPENIRENVQKTIFEQLTNRLKSSTDIKLTEEEVKNVSTDIELELFKCFGDTGQKYRNKYRSLIFNIKDAKNQTLWRRICDKAINPYDLVRLSPDDLASQELAMWREREAKHQLDMIKKSELELLNCNRQYVLKTHKGEQVVEEDRNDKLDNMEVIKSLTEGSSLSTHDTKTTDSSKDRDKKSSSKHKENDRSRDRDRSRRSNKDRSHRSHRSSSRDRRRSRSRDRRHSDRKRDSKSRSNDRDRSKHRKSSSHKSSRHSSSRKDIISTTEKLDKKSKEILEQLVDNKIVPPLEDRLWKHVPQDDVLPGPESDSDHEPSSTVTIPTPPRTQEEELFSVGDSKNDPISPGKESSPIELERSTSPPPRKKPAAEIWRGVINMIDVAQISITAHEVSGDCSGLNRELSENLDIVGRISPETVWEYIGKMKCSNSKGISLIRLNATNVEEKMPYLALYSYLSSRDRLGVVKSLNKAVKDFYIYPLAPQKPIPQVLLPLNGPGFEESRPALLLGIIVRDKRKRPTTTVDISNLPILPKKPKLDNLPLPTASSVSVMASSVSIPSRSYTPPPMKDIRMKLLPPVVVPSTSKDEDDEPYSPVDSSPENVSSALLDTPPGSLTDPLVGFPAIPALPSSTIELQRQMEELNKKIEMQKSEITSMTQNIVSASSEIGTSALANIALPSNLQQILDSIKTIGETSEPPVSAAAPSSLPPPNKEPAQIDLTIPLMIPKTFTPRSAIVPQSISSSPLLTPSDTIPLKLPTKPKIKPLSVNSPLLEEKHSGASVLSSLSEEDLIKKAAEMLGENNDTNSSRRLDRDSTPKRTTKIDITLPPVPGLEN